MLICESFGDDAVFKQRLYSREAIFGYHNFRKNAIVENCTQKVRSCVLAASCNIEKGNHNLNGFHTIGGIGWICGKGKLSTRSIGPCIHK